MGNKTKLLKAILIFIMFIMAITLVSTFVDNIIAKSALLLFIVYCQHNIINNI